MKKLILFLLTLFLMSNTSTTAPKPLSDSVPVISQDIISQDPMSDDVRALSLTEAIEPSQQSVKDNVYSSNTNCDTNSKVWKHTKARIYCIALATFVMVVHLIPLIRIQLFISIS